MKMLLTSLLLFTPILAFSAPVEPVTFSCDNGNYTLYSGSTGSALVKDGELMSDVKFSSKSYANNENAGILEFNQWGASGGMHNHYTAVFDRGEFSGEMTVTPMDADNTPRGPAKAYHCKIVSPK